MDGQPINSMIEQKQTGVTKFGPKKKQFGKNKASHPDQHQHGGGIVPFAVCHYHIRELF